VLITPFTRLHSPAPTVVYDINGRESAEAKPVLEGTRATLEQYIYCSSAGVYLKSDQMPHRETDATDVKSRHKGKLDTESYLKVRTPTQYDSRASQYFVSLPCESSSLTT